MAVIALKDVQQWLEPTKLQLTELNTDLAESARAIAFSIVGEAYDTTTWVNPGVTPAAVKAAISLLVAGWTYQRAYSQNGTSKYGISLESKAMRLLEGIANGTNSLMEVPSPDTNLVDFFPTDASGYAEVYDAMGHLVGAAGSNDVAFTMSQRF